MFLFFHLDRVLVPCFQSFEKELLSQAVFCKRPAGPSALILRFQLFISMGYARAQTSIRYVKAMEPAGFVASFSRRC